MKFLKFAALSAILSFSTTAIAENADVAVPEIQKWAANPSVVAAVKEHNKNDMQMAEIERIDKEWTATNGEVKIAKALLNNDAAKYLKAEEAKKPYFIESILTGNKGENVAITALTSDYWQGDEPKFVEAYNNGKGAVYVSRAKRDKSTDQVISQVSVPVMDGGQAIGTLTVGVIVNKLQ